jgi:outer membrane autotransporter protein
MKKRILLSTVAYIALGNQSVLANNECGTYTGPNGTVTCDTSTYLTGPNDDIIYNATTIDGIIFNISDITLITATPAVTVMNGATSSNALVFTGDNFDITTTTAYDYGLYISQRGNGTSNATVSSGTISTEANSAYAVRYIMGSSNTNTENLTLGSGLYIDTSGTSHGVFLDHFGTGDIHLVSEANVHTLGGDANALRTVSRRGNIIIEDIGGLLETEGGTSHGIFGWAAAGGDITITVSSDIITHGHTANGVVAYAADFNDANPNNSDVFINITNSGSITTYNNNAVGILAYSDDTGTINISHAGSININAGDSSFPSHGIYAVKTSSSSTEDINIDIADTGLIVTAGPYGMGIVASSEGTGTVNITTAGTIQTVGTDADSIYAASAGGTFDVDVTGGTITSGADLAAGIHTIAAAGGTINITSGAIVDATASGIAIHDGDVDYDGVDETSGGVIVTTAGTVIGDAILGLGNDIFNLTGGDYGGDIYGDDVTASVNDGDDTFSWSGGNWHFGFYGTNGSDTANISVSTYDGTSHVLDGGDDLSIADGWLDTLTFKGGINAEAYGANILNWENIIIDNATIAITDGTLDVGTAGEASTGLSLINGGVLDASMGLIVNGNVVNGAVITMQDGTTGDTLTINGDYTGNSGTLQVDTVLGDDTSSTDTLVVNGNASGTTGIVINNTAGAGTQTTNGILVVDVSGTSDTEAFLLGNGDYVLSSGEDAIVAGAYGYALRQIGDDWYLQSEMLNFTPIYQPATPVYEVYAQALLGMNGLSTLQQRVGNRYWHTYAPTNIQNNDSLIEEDGIWTRMEGSYGHFEPDVSTSGATFSQNRWNIEAGTNDAEEKANGKLVTELLAYFGTQDTHVSSFYGDGTISTKGYGIGANLTWYDNNGLYIDAQTRVRWYEGDLSSNILGSLIQSNDGFGYTLSAEIGKRMPWKDGWTFTPQAQLVYSNIDFNDFIGPNGESVTLSDGESLRGRIGISAQQEKVWKDGEEKLRRNHLYGIANLYYEFMDGTSIEVSGTALTSKPERWWGEIGIGSSYGWGDDIYSVYGEISMASSLSNLSDNYSLKGNIGFRMKW